MLIAVAKRRDHPGVEAPGVEDLTYDWRKIPGHPLNTARIEPHYEVVPLEEGLEQQYKTDAHAVGYVLFWQGEPVKRQPRINKSSIPWIYSLGFEIYMCTLFGDWDNPGHASWNFDHQWIQNSEHVWDANPWLQQLGKYYTHSGQRFLQPLDPFLSVLGADPVIDQWIGEGISQGIPLDRKCNTWPHHFRLPHVNRSGKWASAIPQYRKMCSRDLSSWARVPRFPPQIIDEFGPAGRACVERDALQFGWESSDSMAPKPRHSKQILHAWVREVPSTWEQACRQIGIICKEVPLGERHAFYLRLAGFLIHRGMPIEQIPVSIGLITDVAGHNRAHHVKNAKNTARKYAAGFPVSGLGQIAKSLPLVAKKLGEICPSKNKRIIQNQMNSAPRPPVVTIPEAQDQMYKELRFGSLGITFLSGECGVGKTYVATRVAADQHYETKRTPSGRVPAEGRMVITCDKNKLAIQIINDLNELNVPARRFFGPASLLDDLNKPVCKYVDAAQYFSRSGLSVRKLLCLGAGKSPCEYLEGCVAAKGWDGTEDAPIVVTTHAKILEAIGDLGKHAVTVIDEPPSPLNHHVVSEGDLLCTIKNLSAFGNRYAKAMEPLLEMVLKWLQVAEVGTTVWSIHEITKSAGCFISSVRLERALIATHLEASSDPGVDAIRCAIRAIGDESTDTAPPLKSHEAIFARSNKSRAHSIGRSAKTLRHLQEAAATVEPAKPPLFRIVEFKEEKQIQIVCPNHAYKLALQTQSRVVILDATSDLQVPAVAALTGLTPSVRQFAVDDGAPIERAILPYSTANRAKWLSPRGLPLWENGILSALRQALVWVGRADSIAIVSFQPIVIALGATLYPAKERWGAIWGSEGLGLPPGSLDLSKRVLGPFLLDYGSTQFHLGHYFGTRGLNHLQSVEALVSLGDPRPSVDSVRLDAQYLGLSDDDFITRFARIELTQVHGRLRAPQRKIHAKAIHVGVIVPGGMGWNHAMTLEPEDKNSQFEAAMSMSECKTLRAKLGLNIDQLAVLLDVSARSLKAYEYGERKIPSGIAAVLRRIANQASSSSD